MSWCLIAVLIGYCLAATCNIQDYGAKGDGKTDNTKAIQDALNACKSGGTVVVPSGTFLSYPVSLSGATSFTFQITGTIRAGTINNWPLKGNNYEDFFVIEKATGLTITGNGVFDGQGTPWYIAFDQKTLKYNRPRLMIIQDCSKVTLSNFKLYNSPKENLILNNVQGGDVGYINITDDWYNSGKTEPHNTDGIDVGKDSKNIRLHNLWIYNGDDSVAIKPGTTAGGCTADITVESSQFFRGHGASIGSVPSGCVQNIFFRSLTMDGQMAGCNIKSYGNSPGFIKNITWQDITLTNTDYCIHINANYQAGPDEPPNLGATIEVSGIHLTNVKGTNCQHPAVFDCQSAAPCEDIELNNVNVATGAKETKMDCTNAHGTVTGTCQPPSCLTK